MNSETKNCQNCKKDFLIEPDDFAFYEKIKVPAPTFCPECRARRRFVWRSENALYKRKSDYSGNIIFSSFSPESQVKVYENDFYYSDGWDPLEHGRDYDFSKPFFEQLVDLFCKVPLPALTVVRTLNSDYCNNVTAAKNCYLVFNTSYVEDSAYSNNINNSHDCVDDSHLQNCELCYESFWLSHCSKVFFSSQCENSIDIYFSKNLIGCNNCFACNNLRNKNYYIWNKPCSKEEYFEKLKNFNLSSYKSINRLREEAKLFHQKFPNKYIEGTKNIDVSGAYISGSKHVHDSYLIKEGENLRYCQYLALPPNKDCYDHTVFGNNNELTYECACCGLGTNNIKFCGMCYPDVRGLQYSLFCGSSSDLFGCASLRKKQYCILNKQYSKEEYEALLPKIIQHMNEMPYTDKKGVVYKYGEFFPSEFSPFAYNETIAQEHWSLTKETALTRGYAWRDVEQKDYKVTLEAVDLPDNSKDISETIVDEIIGCDHNGECIHQCKKAFKIILQEVQFYKKMNLPLPHLCPNCRREERLEQRHKLKFYNRQCMCEKTNHGHEAKCQNEFETSYAPDRPEIVYCESCYNAEVV